MIALGPIGFLAPWLLLGLLALPVLWWLLRAVPPAPNRVRFPGVRILLGLDDLEKTPDRTPWWLLLLRLLAVAAAILAFARPVLNPEQRDGGSGPLLLIMDGGWASAPDWAARLTFAETAVEQAARDGRPVALVSLADPHMPVFREASDILERVTLATPAPLWPDRAGFAEILEPMTEDFATLWLHDGIAGPGTETLAALLAERGKVTMIGTGTTAAALTPGRLDDGNLAISALAVPGAERPITAHAIGPDPSGIERVLARATGTIPAGEARADLMFDIPLELRNRITRFALSRAESAGGVALADDGLRRRKVGLIAAGSDDEGVQITRPLHFLRKALLPTAELIEAPLADILTTAPDMIIMADVGRVTPAEQEALVAWIADGGMLLRFAGPRLAESGIGGLDEDPLLPVRLRAGGRSVGGAMSWGAPKRLRPFDETSPFFGLALPLDVDVSTQVMAQPDLDLPNKVMAALEDGTPLVTGTQLDAGRVVLFHVTANADWSSLPISGLFVEMLERLSLMAGRALGDASDLEGQKWTAEHILTGFGTVIDAPPMPAIDGAVLVSGPRDMASPPGIYAAGDRRAAINLMDQDTVLAALTPPPGVTWGAIDVSAERPLHPPLLSLALILLAIDILATLWISGRLRSAATAALALIAAQIAPPAEAQGSGDDAAAIYAANNTVLAFVETGDSSVDRVSEAGLRGLTTVLNNRTAIEPVAPVGVDLETDALSFYPFLYWPISERQSVPSDAAYARLNAFLRSGGMILFDTRDAHLGGGGLGTPNGRILQKLAAKLDVPPLEPVPDDHVLTRTFYLLQNFPGRWAGQTIWAEAAPEAEAIDGLPFRNLNDGVTPIIIGGNDWASAWAISQEGQYMFPVGRGGAGQRQREIAYRFGVNLIMYVMTGNYKSDQVHVPALLERIGQ